MIRLFAPPTKDGPVRPDLVTATTFIVHLAAAVVLLVPFARAVKADLTDRLLVYLVPPDKVESGQAGPTPTPFVEAAPHPAAPPRGVDESGSPGPVARAKAAPSPAQGDTTPAGPLLPSDNALTVLEVDSAVVRDPSSAGPEYPPRLLARGLEGWASVRYVVDTLGQVDTLTYRVVTATHMDFALAVRRALPGMRFRPAMQEGHSVRQLVEQTFRFKITNPDTARPTPPSLPLTLPLPAPPPRA